jgi:hypothetical protein
MEVIPSLSDGGGALIWTIHHALADGFTGMRLASEVLWDEEPRADAGPGARRHASGNAPHPRLGALRAAAREAPQPWRSSPFDGRIGTERSVAFATAELEGLRAASALVEHATVNDAVLSVVAGGLRRWLEARHGHLGAVRVKVPVSLHGVQAAPGAGASESGDAATPEAGNRDSFFCLDLPLGSANPLDRLTAIRDATQVRKQEHDAQRLDSLMRELGRASPRLRRFAEHALAHPRSFALTVSNVPGARRPVRVLDSAVTSMYSLAEIRDRHALRVAASSLAGSLNFGLVADPTLVDNVDQLAEAMEAEARELVALGARQ